MKIMALDTSGEHCSVALNLHGEVIGRCQHAPRRHTELILPMLDQLLADAGLAVNQLDAIAFGRGPGSFTGVRIATGVTQGIALGADLPVVPISTLAALAQRGFRERNERAILVALDARMQEVYCAGYRIDDSDLALLVEAERVLPPDQVQAPQADDWFGVGSAWAVYAQVLQQRTGLSSARLAAELFCRAEEMALLAQRELEQGRVVSADQALPVYLRDQVAWKKTAPALAGIPA